MALITTAEAKTQIPALAGATDDPLLSTLITETGRLFARYCGYPGQAPTMESTSYTRDYSGTGTRELVLDVWPVTAVSSVYDDVDWTFGAGTLVASGDYAIRDERALRLTATAAHSIWVQGAGNVRVAYTAGYSSVPDDLKRLAAIQVRHLYDLRTVQGKASVSQSAGTTSYREAALMPTEVRIGLAGYRLPRSYL